MASNEYTFQTRWRLAGSRESAYAIIEETADYVRWWPSVWLKIETVNHGDANRIGSVYRLTTKGWLPYILHWQATTLEKRPPERIVLEASGDFVGRGVWTFLQDGPETEIIYDWSLRADKPVLRYLSFVLKPLFAYNHQWAMRKGLESLRLEMARRTAPDDAARQQVPAPPPPVFFFGRPKGL